MNIFEINFMVDVIVHSEEFMGDRWCDVHRLLLAKYPTAKVIGWRYAVVIKHHG